MIGFLRFLGLMNAAAWFGAAVFFSLGVEPVFTSRDLSEVIGSNNFPYFSFPVGNIAASSFFRLHVVCGVIAILYLMAEWLYFGKYPPKKWLIFVFCLVLLGVFRGYWVQPALKSLHEKQHGRQSGMEERQAAARAFTTWKGIARAIDLLLAAGLGFYVWRTGNPSDPMRFVSATKFRS